MPGVFSKKRLFGFVVFYAMILRWITKNAWVLGLNTITTTQFTPILAQKSFFIYLSYDYYETKYRGKINLWKPNERRIKVQFDKNLYEYLLSVLPKKQAMMLQQDFRILFSEK